MSAKDTDIPIAYLREAFADADGILTWRKRPREHFGSDAKWNAFNTRFSGKRADNAQGKRGYRRVRMTFAGHERSLLAHRIAFALAHSRWPFDEVDHRNRIPSDGSISNLREVTHAQNHQNQSLRKDNTSGVKGVGWHTKQKRWRAYIQLDGRHIHCGYFDHLEDAIAARRAAETELHPFA